MVWDKFRGVIGYFGKITLLFCSVSSLIFTGKKRVKEFFSQIITLGIDSFPIVSLIALFTGIILAFQTAYQLQKISSEIYIASLVALSITRELGPVLTALIVAGRSGASITAQIGSMRVTEQIDALKSLATNPVDYLIVPRFLALVVALPLLVIYGNIIGIFGGYIVGSTKLGISLGMYFRMSIEALALKDIFSGLMKAVVFGAIVGIVSCYEGFVTQAGAMGVGRAVTKSVVKSFVLILTADCLLTAIFYVIFP